jgi:hypothetical protein
MLFHSGNKIEKKRLFPGKSVLNNYPPGFLSQQQTAEILSIYNIPNAPSLFVTPDNINSLSDISFPVCLKGISADVIHKSELNAVKLNIRSYEELRTSAVEVGNSFHVKGFSVDSFLIQPFLTAKHELLVGGFRDPAFGPVIMFGSGGKYVEVINDTCIKSAYLSDDDIDDMLDNTIAGKIIKGVRGEKSADLKIIKSIIRNSAQMMLDNKNISEFDLNPVIVTQDENILSVDTRIKWS